MDLRDQKQESNGPITLAPQRSCEKIRLIPQFPGHLFNVLPGALGNITGQRRLIENNGNGGG